MDRSLHALFRGRVSLAGLAGLPSLRLTTVGRRSGQPRGTDLLYFPYDGDFVLVGSNWGSRRDPGWAFNLRAHPEAVVVVRGRDIAVTATPVRGERYAELWPRLLEFWPGYGMQRAEAAGSSRSLYCPAANSHSPASPSLMSDLDGMAGNLV